MKKATQKLLMMLTILAVLFVSIFSGMTTSRADSPEDLVSKCFEGETFKVTVTYGSEAAIPEEAELLVSELLPETDEYEAYLSESAEALGEEALGIVGTARFFDIEFQKDGEKIEPEAAVSVIIELAEAAEAAPEDLKVVHFAEEGTEVISDVTVSEEEILFDTESFSVYGVLTVPPIQGVNDLGGKQVTLGRNGRYVTSQVLYNVGSPFRLGKTDNPQDAATWTFEDAGEGYGYKLYNISTMVNGEKRYLYMGPVWDDNNSAHTTLELDNTSTPKQAFAVVQNNDGTYTIFIGIPNNYGYFTLYYLNEWWGEVGNGFAGYNQDTNEDNLNITLKTNQPLTQRPGNYAVIVEDEENDTYYAVMEDGSLVEVEYDESTGVARVKLDKPLTWAYTSAWDGLSDDTYSHNDGDDHPDWEPFNLRIDYDARSLNPGTQLSNGDYYRYISPASDNGIAQEDEENPSHHAAKWANAMTYEDYKVHGVVWNGSGYDDTGKYIGADFANKHITGNVPKENAAKIHFARIENVPEPNSQNEAVTHIDIGIIANATLHAPLAYGKYYDEDGNLVLEVSPENDVTLDLTKKVDITKEDIMNASLKAYDKNDNEIDDAYYITGYTANEHTEHSAVQVRMDGSFKVSTLDPYTGWYARANDDPDRRIARKDNQVYYEISTEKEVTFPLVYEGKQLYGMNGKPLSITTPMDVSGRFSYWDENNECPIIKPDFEQKYPFLQLPGDWSWYDGRNNGNWKDGSIIDNNYDMSWQIYGRPPYPGDSGMDFILTADVTLKDRILAVEIQKTIEDTNGNPIKPQDDISNTFSLYYSDDAGTEHVASVGNGYAVPDNKAEGLDEKQEGYEKLGEGIVFEVPGGDNSDGSGAYYDYEVEPGMYYVEEDSAQLKEGGDNYEIVDVDGMHWVYQETRVETEYVWRNDGVEGRHVVDKDYFVGDNFSGVPEVLGEYKFEGWEDANDGKLPRNGFLEFYVYNVYTNLGSLKLQKKLTVNGQPVAGLTDKEKALTDGTYTFTVASTTLKDKVEKTVTMTFKNGMLQEAAIDGQTVEADENGFITVSDLPADTYTVKEAKAENGASPVGDNPLSVVVSAADTKGVQEAVFTNNINTEAPVETGDRSIPMVWGAICGAALIAVIALLVLRKRWES